jgi:adenylyl-sulfate kinase
MRKRVTILLDGDDLRRSLSRDLDFTPQDRHEHGLRVARLAAALLKDGAIVVCALVSPYRRTRQIARRICKGRFVEVYVCTSVEVCQRRDTKGLYRANREARLVGLTGVDSPYEPPTRADVVIDAETCEVDESVGRIVERIYCHRYSAMSTQQQSNP